MSEKSPFFNGLLVLADKNGVVDATPTSISRRTNVPLEIITEAIARLESPDPTSRTPDHEGRRILRLDSHRDWGWRIVNFIKYRESATKEMLRMAEADRKRAYRAKFHRPSSLPSTPPLNIQKQRENSPGTCPGLSGTCPPHLTTSERISHERALDAVVKELEKLGKPSDHDKGSKKFNRIVELETEKQRLLSLLNRIA